MSFTTATDVAVEQLDGEIPMEFKLHPSYPNPFNPETTIRFDLPQESAVRLTIYDPLGREVEVLVSDRLSRGRHEFTWNASGMPTGLYFYQLTAGKFSQTMKMVLLK